ncbi:MAG: hypothetical protein PGN34_07575 [Methylobacterium frigidaeris]
MSLVLGQRELSAIDEWRRSNARLPSRSQAIRHLANRGLLVSEALDYASQASSLSFNGNGDKVLIIDDDKTISLVISIVLGSMGFNIVGTASTPEEAIDISHSRRPNIIISETVIGRREIGVGLVNSILENIDALAIFCTSTPEFFLTGSSPEPSYLMMKPLKVHILADVARQAAENGNISVSGDNR